MTLEMLLDKIANVHALRVRVGMKVRREEQQCVLVMIKLDDAMRGKDKNRLVLPILLLWKVKSRGGGLERWQEVRNTTVAARTEIAAMSSHQSTW